MHAPEPVRVTRVRSYKVAEAQGRGVQNRCDTVETVADLFRRSPQADTNSECTVVRSGTVPSKHSLTYRYNTPFAECAEKIINVAAVSALTSTLAWRVQIGCLSSIVEPSLTAPAPN